ncbi:MAG: 7-cyano-7-deazaguanine synthase QueC [Ignavibacteriales bacterium]|nr:7-cyano-7-deazaguanine synthase QueC [Ignavibacteriales bacterium]
MKNRLCIVALSGGLDSCVTAALANEEFNLALLHINYGQRTERRELQAFNDIADFYKTDKKLIVNLKYFSEIGSSSLTDRNMEVSKFELNSDKIPNSYVPFRNANILSICTSWAESINCQDIFIGAVYEDSSGYPDCRPDFFSVFNKVIELGTKPNSQIKIHTPIINMSKKQIIQKGIELNAPIHLTWSCYKDEVIACGECDSCALRLRGFQELNIEDPIRYKIIHKFI